MLERIAYRSLPFFFRRRKPKKKRNVPKAIKEEPAQSKVGIFMFPFSSVASIFLVICVGVAIESAKSSASGVESFPSVAVIKGVIDGEGVTIIVDVEVGIMAEEAEPSQIPVCPVLDISVGVDVGVAHKS